MGYFKTLMIDPSAAREYSQRWAQNDQVGACSSNSYLVSSRWSTTPTTSTTVSQPVNLVRPIQNDQMGSCNTHLVSSHEICVSMTPTIVAAAVPVNITREHVGKALYQWRKNVEHNPRDLNAVNRAALNLEASPWYMTPDGELVITSASDSRKRYHVNPDGCDCRAAMSGRACWHVAAYRLLHTADAMRRMEAPQKPVQRATAQALVDELY